MENRVPNQKQTEEYFSGLHGHICAYYFLVSWKITRLADRHNDINGRVVFTQCFTRYSQEFDVV